jgi:hypothetical protein
MTASVQPFWQRARRRSAQSRSRGSGWDASGYPIGDPTFATFRGRTSGLGRGQSFVAEQPVVVASDEIVIGRGTYICRRRETEDASVLANYWYGSHNLNSEVEANRAFLEGPS